MPDARERPGKPRLFAITGGRGRRIPLPALSRVQTLVVLGVALGWFALGAGPIWRHPWEPNRSIVTSYLTIPPLVLVFLLASRKLSLAAWVFDSFRVAVIKFLLTAFALVAMWAAIPPTGRTPMAPPPPVPLGIASSSTITFIPEARERHPSSSLADARGRVRGRVVDAAGRPVAGALVWIGGGLEALDFDPPADPLPLVDDGHGFPSLVIAQVGRRLEARSGDGRLHTLLGLDAAGATAFSVPLIAAGTARPLVFTEPYGLLRVRCGVHAEEHSEHDSALLVLAHPFAATTGGDGGFEWSVPIATLVVEAARVDGTRAAPRTVEVAAGGSVEVEVTLASVAADGG